MATLLDRYRHVKRREFLEAVKSAIEAGNTSAVSTALERGKRLLGAQACSTLATVITGRMDNSLGHDQADSVLASLAQSVSPRDSEVWFILESLCQAAGCFVAGADYAAKGFQALKDSGNPQSRFLAAIHQRDLDCATEVYHETTHKTDPFWDDAGHYLWLWSNKKEGAPHWTGDTMWAEYVENHAVSIVGPAPTPPRAKKVSADTLVCRIIAPGVVSWPKTDIASGRCDIAYANSKTTKWFIREHQQDALESFDYVNFRTESGLAMGIERSRTAFHHKRLLPMPWDRTNMVPLAAWDLLHVPGVSVSIAGTTFFASATAYTANDVRYDAERKTSTDQSGSTGIVLERCVSFSHHNIGAHLNFMANLATAGALSFDRAGSRVVGLSYRDYMAEIDEFYGRPRV